MSNQELIVVRGLPGSGKSTFADLLMQMYSIRYYVAFHFEADQWQYDDGVYNFKPERVHWSHKQCQEAVRKALEYKDPILDSLVVVSNTFSRVWEMEPYLEMAKEFGAKLTVLTVEGDYGSIHNVPQESIDKMKERWERYA